MAFPTIEACIVCEAARPELQNKHILLGFFGIAPYVRIHIKDFKLPVSLCFVFCTGQGVEGKHSIDLRLTDPQGTVSSNSIQGIRDQEPPPGSPSTNIFMAFQGLLGTPGAYRVALVVDGREHYSTTATIENAPVNAPVATARIH
jgi:hypothetical protein